MDPLEYLRLLRRRWWIILLVLGLSVAGALLTLPAGNGPDGQTSATSYSATHTLLQAPDVPNPVNLDLTVLFATTGEVPELAAKRLKLPADQGAVLATRVSLTPDTEIGALRITVVDSDPTQAVAIADAFAEEVKAFLRSSATRNRQTEAATLQASLNSLQSRTLEIQRKLLANPIDAPILEAQRATFTSRYQSVFDRLQTLQDQGAASSALQTLATASPVPIAATGSPVPDSPRGRLALAVVLGLLLGAALVLLADRLDTRLRSREAVEDATRLPVVGEIPLLDRKQIKSGEIASASHPRSGVAEAYRALRSSLLLVPSRPVPIGDTPEPVVIDMRDWRAPQVVLVTSAAPADGKTNTVVNLAATLAESGRSVIVLDADFRKPAANRYLGVPRSAGLSELLSGSVVGGLSSVLQPTSVPGVQMVTAGTSSRHPAALLSRLAEIVAEARTLAEVVLIDSAPVLAANDATDIVPHVDTVLVVSRANRTTRPQAERVSELMARLGVPVLGVVLQGSKDAPGGAGGYGNYGEARPAPLEIVPAPVVPTPPLDLTTRAHAAPPVPAADAEQAGARSAVVTSPTTIAANERPQDQGAPYAPERDTQLTAPTEVVLAPVPQTGAAATSLHVGPTDVVGTSSTYPPVWSPEAGSGFTFPELTRPPTTPTSSDDAAPARSQEDRA